MTFASALTFAQQRPKDVESLSDLARSALQEGEEERALPLLEQAAISAGSALLWRWKALLERALDEHQKALHSFAEAAHLDSGDAGIAHGWARTALEAGIDAAETLYDRARSLAPGDGSVLLGQAAARLASGHGERAEAELDALLRAAPLWIEGHTQLAQLRSMLGRRDQAHESLRRALAAQPTQVQLWQARFDLHIKADDFGGLDDSIDQARSQSVPDDALRPYAAIAATELGRLERADSLFGESAARGGHALSIWRIRHLLRSGRAEQAARAIDAELSGPNATAALPYAAIAWRLTGDERVAWLEGDPRLVSSIDLADRLPPLDELASVLRSIHVAKGEYLDQSVRGGTQTDGPLFSRIEPTIRRLRATVTEAVKEYVSAFPIDPRHPTFGQARDRRIRFAGSWSVWLRGSGFHESHVHPQGWISSALYIALPAPDGDDPHAGWLQLGQPPATLRTGLQPSKLIKPEPGRLVLFPSWMWHGTKPFRNGERLTVAFDVAHPR